MLVFYNNKRINSVFGSVTINTPVILVCIIYLKSKIQPISTLQPKKNLPLSWITAPPSASEMLLQIQRTAKKTGSGVINIFFTFLLTFLSKCREDPPVLFCASKLVKIAAQQTSCFRSHIWSCSKTVLCQGLSDSCRLFKGFPEAVTETCCLNPG